MAKRTLVVLGIVLSPCFILHLTSNRLDAFVARESTAAKQQVTAKKSVREKRDDAVKEDARTAVAEMIRKLGKAEYVDFMHQHSPIDEYISAFREGRAGQVPFSALPQFVKLTEILKSMQDAEIVVDRSGKTVRFVKQEELPKADRLQSRYSSAEKPTEPGYGDDLTIAIESALQDLKAGNYEVFMAGMLPQSTVLMMKTDDRWDGMVQSLSGDSTIVTRMIEDLSTLVKATPVIDGATAEFTLPNVVSITRGRRTEIAEVGERIIRFSLIEGSWRFFDSNASTANELDAALNRDATGESLKSELVLEKIGSDWRLSRMPRGF